MSKADTNTVNLKFKPVTRFTSGGNEIQVAATMYKGVEITERSFFPWNVFKEPTFHYYVDIVLPMGTLECLTDELYTEEGYGIPKVDSLEKAMLIVDTFDR